MTEVDAASLLDASLAKLAAPAPPPCHVSRSDRDVCLRSCLKWRMVLVAAPAGYGKTTLMGEWYARMKDDHAADHLVAWLSVDDRDVDPQHLWRHVLAACSLLWPNFLTGSNLPDLVKQDDLTPFLASLSNRLFEHMGDTNRQVVLFLDDVDAMGDSGLSALLDFFASSLPANLRVVASVASVLAMPVEFCREDVLCHFPADVLAFTRSETAKLLEKLRGSASDDAELHEVMALTGGWVAGIRLGASSLDEAGAASAFGESGAVDVPGPIDRYFSAQMADKASDELFAFLLETSVVDQFCPALCDRIASRADSRAAIETLVRRGLLVDRTEGDGRGPWYAYHPLFLRWLRSRLMQLRQSQIRELNHRASEWFEENGAPDQSAKHLLMASDVDLIEQLARSARFARPDESSDFVLWASALPAADFARDPLLSLLVTWAYVLCGRPHNALIWLDVFQEVLCQENLLGRVDAEQLRAAEFMAQHVRIKCREFEGCYAEAIEAYNRLLEEDEGMSHSLRCVVVHALGESHERVGAFDRAQECYLESEAIAEMAGLTFFVAFSRYEFGWILVARGDLLQAQERCYLALHDCPADYTLFGALHILLAYIQLEMNRLSEAKVSIRRALKRLSSGRNVDMLVEARAVHACYLAATGEHDTAHKVILQTILSAQGAALPRSMLLFAYAMQARVELDRDNLAGVISAHDHLTAAVDEADVQYVTTALLIEARILHFQGNPTQALERAASACNTACDCGLGSLHLEALLLQVVIKYESGSKARAFALVNEALMLASGQGALRAFLREGHVMRDVLHEVINIRKTSNGVRSYAKTVLAAFGREGTSAESAFDVAVSRTLSPLTPREREVLRLLNAGMARKEIAHELGVSVNTVKTHLNNVYAKLGVDNRIDAFRLMNFGDSV